MEFSLLITNNAHPVKNVNLIATLSLEGAFNGLRIYDVIAMSSGLRWLEILSFFAYTELRCVDIQWTQMKHTTVLHHGKCRIQCFGGQTHLKD